MMFLLSRIEELEDWFQIVTPEDFPEFDELILEAVTASESFELLQAFCEKQYPVLFAFTGITFANSRWSDYTSYVYEPVQWLNVNDLWFLARPIYVRQFTDGTLVRNGEMSFELVFVVHKIEII